MKKVLFYSSTYFSHTNVYNSDCVDLILLEKLKYFIVDKFINAN